MKTAKFGPAVAWAAAALLPALAPVAGAQAQMPRFYGVDEFTAPPDPHWAAVTKADVDAAWRLLEDNHPGASPAVDDPAFKARLAAAHAKALARARSATSYRGYSATLAEFAGSMGDKHIWSRPTYVVNVPRWAGVIVSRRPGSWVVTDADGDNARLLGATLVACDGRPADRLAQDNLENFHAVWSIEAQQAQAAPWLFVDEGNPFVRRPGDCTFSKDGKETRVTLEWTRIKRQDLLPRITKAQGGGQAGFGVRRVGAGYWISLQSLLGQASAVVEEVKAQGEALRRADFVVLDLRGNGGGSSGFGDQIARSLLGDARVDAASGEGPAGCDTEDGSWRVSDGNIGQLKMLLDTLGDRNGPEFRRIISALLQKAAAARAAGRQFTGPVACPAGRPPQAHRTLPAGLMKGPLIFVTDNACFSSCLVVTRELRALGAFQVGATTDANTHYLEVREEYLPSGYSMFSTLQALDPSAPVQLGPFTPALPYPGDIADTAALERWVADVAEPAAAAAAGKRAG